MAARSIPAPEAWLRRTADCIGRSSMFCSRSSLWMGFVTSVLRNSLGIFSGLIWKDSITLEPAEVPLHSRNAGDPDRSGRIGGVAAIGHFRVQARQLTPQAFTEAHDLA